MTDSHPSPALSSTVLLLRDYEDSLEVLLVRRNDKLKTAGGTWVFPGGRVETDDFQNQDDDFLAAKIAAVRETQEETGIDISLTALTPFAHWTTPIGVPRRFATWFFASRVTDGNEIQVDGSEIVDYRWLSPSAAIDLQAKGEISIMPPTFICLREVVDHKNSSSAFKALEEKKVMHYNPKRIVADDGTSVILYDDDAAYESGLLDTQGVRNRIFMKEKAWHHERSE
ncbi:hypothetical protein NBRC116493_34670 [Aurantivibrio infirmus]